MNVCVVSGWVLVFVVFGVVLVGFFVEDELVIVVFVLCIVSLLVEDWFVLLF